MLLRHFLVLVLPFIACLLQGLDFALKVAGLDVGLSKSGDPVVSRSGST